MRQQFGHRGPLDRMATLLKSLRIRGVDELAVQQFVVKYSGNHWEEFFEAVFGYEAKIKAREQLANVSPNV